MARGSTSQRRRSPSPASSNEADNPVGGLEELDLKGKEPIQVCKHFFLQNMISRKVVDSDLATVMYKDSIRLCGVEDAPPLADFSQSIEAGINVIGLEIKQVNDQETGKILYILSNSTQDAPAKIATEYKAEEIAFFKSIVEKIMLARDMSYCVTQVDAIKGAKTPITRMVAIQLIKSFLAKGWLALHPSGRLILSPRSLLELAPYLRETYRDDEDDDLEPRERTIVDCNRCLKIVTSGYACPNSDCSVRLHTFCVGARINQSGQCPDRLSNPESPCTQVWKKDSNGKFVGHPIGVSASGLGGDEGHPTSQLSDEEDEAPAPVAKKGKKGNAKGGKKVNGNGKGKGKGKGKKKRTEEDEDEEMDDDDDEEEDDDDSDGAGSATQSAARRSSSRAAAAAGKSKRRAIRDEDEDDEDEEMEE